MGPGHLLRCPVMRHGRAIFDMIPALSQGTEHWAPPCRGPGQGRKNNAAGRHALLAVVGFLAMPPIISRAQADDLRRGPGVSGPSLYLPAAVYATDNARFARQIIAQAAKSGAGSRGIFRGTERGQGPGTLNILRSKRKRRLSREQRAAIYCGQLREEFAPGFLDQQNYGIVEFHVTRGGEGGAVNPAPGSSYQLKNWPGAAGRKRQYYFPHIHQCF